MSEFGVGDKVRITFDNGSVVEGVVWGENHYVKAGPYNVVARDFGGYSDRSVELIEKAKPTMPTEIYSLIRASGDLYRLYGSGWFGYDGRKHEYLENQNWEEVVVVPKAALDKLRETKAAHSWGAVNTFLQAVDK